MKIKISIILLSIILSNTCIAQFKVVKIVSEDIYIRFFYKSEQPSKYTKDDTTFFLCKRIDSNAFTLEKYQRKIKVWGDEYKVVKAKDSLIVYEKIRDVNWKSKIIKLKEPYYLGIKVQK